MSHADPVRGNIVELEVDAIVNAANSTLLGGVDGAIHRAAGPELLAECRTLGGCPTGEARITDGYRLPAKFVIHTVGPVWRGGEYNEAALLASCYTSCLQLAVRYQLHSIAFPAISTGVYGYPLRAAAQIACTTVTQFPEEPGSNLRVLCVCFDAQTETIYRQMLSGQN
ncbi:MAG: O-acetyl-ADP-ribose deacetylase [Pseudomonadales bacterium]|jgi:O-acetyl-ADP-ribose deacetylase (regulator of RNase III)|nr:O-acetyl-ADP-ribose deacetylase [Pseudomonadales bacterium]MDP7145303.1 O-acetyl-ADP-ribose deacetylase [Pseudomonadales bacterium]MDP7360148.1 O-acetyl-ADP-ribose deacetylase [Pseudomonadales bacterium]MDP7595690.1 O-acetyl-ADP-ribose deacetylase [Pseudomonadales bacterium]HJN51514.1 O-acetyl-ADP-ribose deacetylase [Pseudomonadales bacterium]|tara:strand:+ start:253 stop:759 length:507 start_codon:yes stop_codon:yes gene_type:complete